MANRYGDTGLSIIDEVSQDDRNTYIQTSGKDPFLADSY